IVAAWIRADTGVGPAIASGSQVNKGICADLPVAAMNNSKVINNNVASPIGNSDALLNTSAYSNVPNVAIMAKTAIKKPKSPILFITKAFLAALAYDEFLYQKPMSR